MCTDESMRRWVVFGRKRWLIALILASLLVQVGILMTFKCVKFADIAYAPGWNWNGTTELPSSPAVALNVVLPGSFDGQNETFHCITAQLLGRSFPICTYTADDDKFISESLIQGQYYEQPEVERFLRELEQDRRLQFVDVGANIGVWTLPASRLTQVLAVEPYPRSMARLAKAVHLGVVVSNITLVQNAVSDVRTELRMGVNPTNQGEAFLINTTSCTLTAEPSCSVLRTPVRTVLLDDLLPLMRSKAAYIKVDVEGHEVSVFTEQSAGRFFHNVDVPVVYIEWMWCRTLPVEVVQPLLSFFRARNYTAFDINNSRLQENFRQWPINVQFRKPSYGNHEASRPFTPPLSTTQSTSSPRLAIPSETPRLPIPSESPPLSAPPSHSAPLATPSEIQNAVRNARN